MKKILYILFCSCYAILLTGCTKKVIVDESNLREEREIIELIQNMAYDKYGNDIQVNLYSKENYKACTLLFFDNSCLKDVKVDKAYIYRFKITDKNTGKIIDTIEYHDPIIKDGRHIEEYISHFY